MKSSNLSVIAGFASLLLARGEISTGYSVIKVGLISFSSTNSSKSSP